MATGSVDSVKSLRERTGAGMMDCKAALEASGGDIEKAIDFLRKKGVMQAAKRAGRQAREGLVTSRVAGQKAALVEVNCETDFVARTDDFRGLAALALEETLAQGDLALNSDKIKTQVDVLSGKIGEKILVRRVKLIESKSGTLFTYIHSNNKLGVVVEIQSGKPETKKSRDFEDLGKHIAMQIAAANPLGVVRSDVPPAVVLRESAIFKEEIKGKPENIAEKIVQGKLNKFYQSACLLEQPFIRDDKLSIQQLLDQAAKKIGDTLHIKGFVRFQLGESV